MCAPWKVCWAWGIATAIACAQSTFSVQLPNGRTYELPLRAIGGYPAASLAHCAILWEGKARLSARGTVLSTPHGVIRAAPLSFFLAWERRDSSHFIQLPVPVQSDGQHLFVSLHGLGEAIAALWEAQAVWDSPTVLRLRYAPAPVVTTSPPFATLSFRDTHLRDRGFWFGQVQPRHGNSLSSAHAAFLPESEDTSAVSSSGGGGASEGGGGGGSEPHRANPAV